MKLIVWWKTHGIAESYKTGIDIWLIFPSYSQINVVALERGTWCHWQSLVIDSDANIF